MIWWPVQAHDSTKSLPYLATQAGAKVLPSIGGWNDSYNFPDIAADPIKRQNFVDHCINLMTYDFHGSWDPESKHHTPLYSPAVGNPDWCFDGTFTKITQEYNVPAEMINIGIAFYGKGLANCTQLYGPHTDYDGATFSEDEGQPLYYNIMKKMDQFTYFWDDQVKCPYLLGNSINTFVTYDNIRSVGLKAQYVKDYNAKGISSWAEITIYNSNGSSVNFNRTGKSIDVSDLPTGIYFIGIQNEGITKILKFVKN